MAGMARGPKKGLMELAHFRWCAQSEPVPGTNKLERKEKPHFQSAHRDKGGLQSETPGPEWLLPILAYGENDWRGSVTCCSAAWAGVGSMSSLGKLPSLFAPELLLVWAKTTLDL